MSKVGLIAADWRLIPFECGPAYKAVSDFEPA